MTKRIKFYNKVSQRMLDKFYDNKLYVPGRLFADLYQYPTQLIRSRDQIKAAVYYDGKDPIAISVYADKFKFGWRGSVDGIVGVYVKPEHRKKNLATKVLSKMVKNMPEKRMGYTHDLRPVARKVSREQLSELY